MKTFVAAIERADAGAVLTFLSTAPSFQWVDLDGRVYGPEETRKHWQEGLGGAQSMRYPTASDRIIVLAPDAAFQMSHSATSGIALKDGTKLDRGTFTFGCLWRKEAGAWKIAACQESSLPPVPEKPAVPAKK